MAEANIGGITDNYIGLNKRGLEYLNKNVTGEAIRKFKEAIAVKENYAEAHFNLGIAYKKINSLQDAAHEFNKTYTIDPNFYQAYYEYALAIYNIKLFEKSKYAISALKNFIQKRPDFADAHFLYAEYLYYNKEVERADVEYKKAIEFDPNNISYRLRYAEFLYLNGLYDEAIAAYNEVLNIDENNEESLNRLLDAYKYLDRQDSKHFEDLHLTIQRYLKYYPKKAYVVITKLDVYKKYDRVDDAITMLKDLIEKFPTVSELYDTLGDIYVEIGNIPESIMVYENAVKLSPKNVNYHYKLGIQYCENDQLKEAEKELIEANYLKPNDIQIKSKLEAIQGKLKYGVIVDEKLEQGFVIGENIKKMPNFNKITADSKLEKILEERWREAIICAENGAYMASTTMLGSLLEGLLHIMALKTPELSGRTKAAQGKQFNELPLDRLISVAHELGWIREDRKEFGAAVRDYRNLIHPREQMKKGIFPDQHTVNISIMVVRAAIDDIINYVNKLQ